VAARALGRLLRGTCCFPPPLRPVLGFCSAGLGALHARRPSSCPLRVAPLASSFAGFPCRFLLGFGRLQGFPSVRSLRACHESFFTAPNLWVNTVHDLGNPLFARFSPYDLDFPGRDSALIPPITQVLFEYVVPSSPHALFVRFSRESQELVQFFVAWVCPILDDTVLGLCYSSQL